MSNRLSEPVAASARIVEVDILRGFALFGVLLVNMYGFGADSVAWDGPADRFAFGATRFFFESKFWTLFSLLFGFGFALQLERAEQRGVAFAGIYVRRLTALFVFGALHALLFDGDILMLYAELGLLLLLFRRVPTKWLLLLAAVLVLVFPLARFAATGDPEAEKEPPISVAEAREELEEGRLDDVYAVGSPAEVAADNSDAIPALPLEDLETPESGLAVLAMFLVGLAIGRSDVLRDIPAHAAAIARARSWGWGLGLAGMATERILSLKVGYAIYPPQEASPPWQLVGDLAFALGVVALAIGYGATILLLAQESRGRALLAPLAPVGRMALSAYLTQSLMFTTLFYGYGFGQVYRLGPVAVSAWAVFFFAIQIVVCGWWTRRFRFGPAEWLWRSITYLSWQKMRL